MLREFQALRLIVRAQTRTVQVLRQGGHALVDEAADRLPVLEDEGDLAAPDLEHGAAWMVRRHAGPLRVLPVAFRYPFLSEQRPEAMVLLGEPWTVEADRPDRAAITDRLTTMLGVTLAALDADLAVERLESYDLLVAGRPSINNRMDRVRHALGLLDEYQPRNG